MMKNFQILIVFTLSLLISSQVFGQIQTPAPSPGAKATQTVGLTEITLEYSRPGVKDREIFGGLVPYGEIWRTGANLATTISFDKDVKVGGQDVKAGKYAVLTVPNKDEWKFMLYTYQERGFGAYVEKDPTVSFTAKADTWDMSVWSFTMAIQNVKSTSASWMIMWDKTVVSVPIEVHTDKQVTGSIEKIMAGPSANDYYRAASYYHDAGKDMNMAYEWIKKANEGDNARFWTVRREALILADMGKKAEAIAAAQRSMDMAEKAGNKDYVHMNEASIKEWSK
jgi:hypothetical protein